MDSLFKSHYPIFILLALFPILSSSVATDSSKHSQGNFTSLSDAVPQLSNLTYLLPTTHKKAPTLGGQNFTHCCLLAVNASLEVIGGYLRKTETDYIGATVEEFLQRSEDGQFPCTATWDGDIRGAPKVSVPAGWLESTCPGWQMSDSKKGHESQWITPFVGFLLPSVVFVLTIPRRRKLAVWKKLFVPDFSQLISWIVAPFAMILAGIFVCCDTLIWLATCFAFASPMILSGIYEAYLDQKVISFLTEKTANLRLTLDMRARLLFVVLVGNLDLDPEQIRGDEELVILSHGKHSDDNERWPNFRPNAPRNPSSPWTHIENLVSPLRSYRDAALGSPRQWPLHDVKCTIPNCTDLYCKEVPLRRNFFVRKEIGRTKTRIRTMLATQLSFGSSVGSPVVFFLGAFSFTLVTTLASLGDEDTSLDLAFGMWYMIIPHISIVSGLLLAGNNPNTLEGVMALEFGDVEEKESFETKHWLNSIFELAYESRYRPKWLWERGRSKQDWIDRVISTYEVRAPSGRRGSMVPDEDMAALRVATTLGFTGWTIVLALTLLLMGVPFVLAFVVSFFTPQVGVSCRSFTILIYAIAQLCQVILWMWAYAGPPSKGKYFTFFRKGGFLDQKGFFTPTNIKTLWTQKTFRSLPTLWALIWFNLAMLFGLGGVMSTIGGTMMQLMGVYTSSKCSINASWWTRPHEHIIVTISKNSELEIRDAKKYWIPCAITAILFLGLVSFCGWWYQRRLRGLFRNLVSELGSPRTDREDIRAVVVPSRNGSLGG
ncbi:hypothetical protein HYALB_00013862 [Hymenoscyphus albidus]|uniref:Uncharacterized protein n=1 Tax=Hymenoscyphus albidus TaxID=595503 RepID=A0A9N9QBX1_9HELO|nr:hypothetical protein HYALB_00013862 [Hymenoscyphus albidus]